MYSGYRPNIKRNSFSDRSDASGPKRYFNDYGSFNNGRGGGGNYSSFRGGYNQRSFYGGGNTGRGM